MRHGQLDKKGCNILSPRISACGSRNSQLGLWALKLYITLSPMLYDSFKLLCHHFGRGRACHDPLCLMRSTIAHAENGGVPADNNRRLSALPEPERSGRHQSRRNKCDRDRGIMITVILPSIPWSFMIEVDEQPLCQSAGRYFLAR